MLPTPHRRKALFIALLLLPQVTFGDPGIEELPPRHLLVGETRTLNHPELKRFLVSSPSIGLARLPSPAPEGALLLKANRPGIAEIWIWLENGHTLHQTVEVRELPKSVPPPSSLEQALAALGEVQVLRSGDRAVLRGTVSTETELGRIRLLEETFGSRIENQTECADALVGDGRQRLVRWIQDAGLEDRLRVEVLGAAVWVRGSAPDEATRTGWKQKLLALFSGARLDISALPETGRTLFFRVFLLEMKKSAFRELGLDWPSHLSGTLLVEGGSLFWAAAPSIDLSLKWLEGKGWARVLSQPELVVRVPGEAELFAGGEIPLEIRPRGGARAGSWVEWKPYGLILKIKTVQSTHEQVRLEIASEISELDRANGSERLPAIQASRMRTQVDARIGEPLFLSGLLQESSATRSNGWPLLRRIPVLGSLFGSEDFIQRRSELVAVLVPLNAPPPAPRWNPLERTATERLQAITRPPKSNSPQTATLRAFRPTTGSSRRAARHGLTPFLERRRF